MKPVLALISARTGFNPKSSGNGFIILCPAHDDKNPSLSIVEGDDGKVLITCHAGCSINDICSAIGIEVYQWLFRKNGFKVSNISYFVYCNGKKEADRFDKKLDFDISLLPYEGNDSWVEKMITKAHECLQSDNIPPHGKSCDYCQYVLSVLEVL